MRCVSLDVCGSVGACERLCCVGMEKERDRDIPLQESDRGQRKPHAAPQREDTYSVECPAEKGHPHTTQHSRVQDCISHKLMCTHLSNVRRGASPCIQKEPRRGHFPYRCAHLLYHALQFSKRDYAPSREPTRALPNVTSTWNGREGRDMLKHGLIRLLLFEISHDGQGIGQNFREEAIDHMLIN